MRKPTGKGTIARLLKRGFTPKEISDRLGVKLIVIKYRAHLLGVK